MRGMCQILDQVEAKYFLNKLCIMEAPEVKSMLGYNQVYYLWKTLSTHKTYTDPLV